MLLNPANLITLLRIGISFVFLIFFYQENIYLYYLAVFLYIVAALTDLLDGYIARQNKQVSDFGKLLDPLADKILLCCGLLPLVADHLFPVWIAVAIISREFAVNGLRTLAAHKGFILAANRLGKYKTTLQLSVILCILVVRGYNQTLSHFFSEQQLLPVWSARYAAWLNLEIEFLIWFTLVMTLLSGFDYFWRNRQLFRQADL